MALFRRQNHFSRLASIISASILFFASNSSALAIWSPAQGNCADGEYSSGLGCISTDMGSGFVTSILQIGVGLGGGVALVLMIYGTFLVTTSEGIPDRIKQGKEIISSAAMGLIFMLTSIFMLNFVGVKILAIPGL